MSGSGRKIRADPSTQPVRVTSVAPIAGPDGRHRHRTQIEGIGEDDVKSLEDVLQLRRPN